MKKYAYLFLALAGPGFAFCCKADTPPLTPFASRVSPASVITLSATLDGSQQVPANSSTATGTFSGSYDTSTRLLTYTVTYTGLTPTAGHIHRGVPGQNGTVAVPFASVATSPITGTATLTQADGDSLVAGKMYVNLHTTAFPGGEIRGNINMPATMTLINAVINNSQQVPANSSTATGTFTGSYDTSTRRLTYTVTYTGLTPTAGHIHRGGPGHTGSVAVPFASVATSPITGNAILTQADGDSLLAGRMYVNLHTTAFPAGEIRGNLAATARTIALSATLSGSQQVPANSSTATGTFTGTVNPATRVLTYSVTYAGLTPTAGHIHRGGPGHAGTVAVPFASVATSPITGTATLTQADLDSLLAGRMYVNLHTTAFPGGEIRGNITLSANGLSPDVMLPLLALYPNPTHGTVWLSGLLPHAAPIELLDALGRVVQQAKWLPSASGEGSGLMMLDVHTLTPGIYLVRAGVVTRRLVVE